MPLLIVGASYLCCHASAGGPERIFKSASLIQTAVRNRLSTKMLEVLISLAKNHKYLPTEDEEKKEYWRRRDAKTAETKAKKAVAPSEALSSSSRSAADAGGPAPSEASSSLSAAAVPAAADAGDAGPQDEALAECGAYHTCWGEDLVHDDLEAATMMKEIEENHGGDGGDEEFEGYLAELRNLNFLGFVEGAEGPGPGGGEKRKRGDGALG